MFYFCTICIQVTHVSRETWPFFADFLFHGEKIPAFSCLGTKKAGKTVLYVTFALFAAALIATFVCLIVYFNKNISNDGYYDTADGSYGKVNQLVLYLASALLIAVALIAAFLCDKKGSFTFDSKSIALAYIYCAI